MLDLREVLRSKMTYKNEDVIISDGNPPKVRHEGHAMKPNKLNNYMFDEFCIPKELKEKEWKLKGVIEYLEYNKHFKSDIEKHYKKLQYIYDEIESLRGKWWEENKELLEKE